MNDIIITTLISSEYTRMNEEHRQRALRFQGGSASGTGIWSFLKKRFERLSASPAYDRSNCQCDCGELSWKNS